MLLIERRCIFLLLLLLAQDVHGNALHTYALEAEPNRESPRSKASEVSQHFEVHEHLHADYGLHLLENNYSGSSPVAKQSSPTKAASTMI